jgi:hypothetical protein
MRQAFILPNPEVAMIENLISPVFTGNKSLKAKLENVRLQIVALRAVEEQLEIWLLEEQQTKDETCQKETVVLTQHDIVLITNVMRSENLMRSSAQSPEWAGLAVIQVMCKPDAVAVDQIEFAKRGINFMLSVGALKKTSFMDPKRGREVPTYEVVDTPSMPYRVGI